MKIVFLLKSLLSWLFRLTLAYPVFLFAILHLTTINSHAAQVTLEWDAINHPLLGGYMVYYGTYSGDYNVSLDVGNWTSCTIADLEENETYYFAVTAYSTEGEESDFSNEVSNSNSNSSHNSYDVGIGGGCFIDTVAFGSYKDPQVKPLKDFGPEYMQKHEYLRPVALLALMTFIGLSYILLTRMFPELLSLSD